MNFDPPTCSWPSADAEGAADLRARVVVLPTSEDGAFERRVADTAAASSSALLRKPEGASACELVVPLPEGTAARALSLVSTARVAELYVVHPTLRERAYVRTVRGADVPDANHHTPSPSHDASTSSDPASAPAPLFYECVSTLGADPCASVVMKLFAPADADAIFVKGVVVELGAADAGAPPASRPSFVPDARAALASIADTSRFIAGLSVPGDGAIGGYGPSPGTGASPGTGTALAAALASALGGARGAGAPPSTSSRCSRAHPPRATRRARAETPTRKRHPNLRFLPDAAKADSPDDDADIASISRRVRRLEATALRVERVVTDAMERIEARLDAMDARVDAAALVARVAPRVDASTAVKPPRSHTKAEWDAETRAAARERRRDDSRPTG